MNDWGKRVGARVAGIAVALAAGFIGGDAKAEWSTETLGGTTVELYSPETTSPVGEGRALMLVLHGCTQTASALRSEGNLEAAADSMGVVMAAPNVPGGGVIAGCWDYYGAFHTRTSGHNGALLQLVEDLLADDELAIDPDQVYIVGFSSGGGQAIVAGCLAPDVFAGVGVVAGPSLGTSSVQISMVATTAEQASASCVQLAGEHAPWFESQAAFTFADSGDFTVSTGYNPINAAMFGAVLSDGLDMMDAEAIDFASLPGNMPAGTGTTYADASGIRVAQLDSTSGVGHAWPSGSGMSGGLLSYVNGNGVNMSQYAAEFFAMHNPRAGGWDPPGGGGDSDGDDSGGETGGSSGGETSTSGTSSDPMGSTSDAPGMSSSESQGDGGASGVEEPEGPGVPGCSVPGHRGPWAWLGLVGLLGLRRRR
jgi:poly(3-hydroxybutyrate) depolymerase